MSDTSSIAPVTLTDPSTVAAPVVPAAPEPVSTPVPVAPVTSTSTSVPSVQEGAQTASSSASQTSTTETTDSSATSEPETAPVVVNDDNGQHVVMPDGTTVTTRQHPYPVSNSEWLVYEQTHSGDQLRYPYKPGDAEYSPYSDPVVPHTSLAQKVEAEIASFAERVLLNPKAEISNIWNDLKKVYNSELAQAISTGGGSGKIEA